MFRHVLGTWYKVPGSWAFGRPLGRLTGIGGSGERMPVRNQVEFRLLAGTVLMREPRSLCIAHVAAAVGAFLA